MRGVGTEKGRKEKGGRGGGWMGGRYTRRGGVSGSAVFMTGKGGQFPGLWHGREAMPTPLWHAGQSFTQASDVLAFLISVMS